MRTADPALSHFAESLAETLRTGDAARFRAYLQGSSLPALGGDLEPPEILTRALALNPDYPVAARKCARLLAQLLLQEADQLRSSDADTETDRKFLLIDALRLATELPAREELFRAVWRLWLSLKANAEKSKEVFASLLRALVFQQVDDTLEGYWLEVLNWQERLDRPWRQFDHYMLFTAWKGLLWIPPHGEQLGGDVVNFDRIERGLLALSRAVANQENGPRLLRHALDLLGETYPRSPDFWASRLWFRVPRWPSALQAEVFRKWPQLETTFQNEAIGVQRSLPALR